MLELDWFNWVLLGIGIILLLNSFQCLIYSTITWEFSHYFDDSYNFLDFPQYNTFFFPQSNNVLSHWILLLQHKGLNVYEPVGNTLKAISIDVVGFDSYSLRVISACVHAINILLLNFWMILLFQKSEFDSSIDFLAVVFSSIFVGLHPLNMEVIGWLSAQNYIFSLFFSLVSSIFLEYALQSSFGVTHCIFSLLCYILAVLVSLLIIATLL